MAIPFDISDDLSCVDGTETVTLRQSALGPPLAVPGVLRRHDQLREAEPSDGQYTATDVVWHLPAAGLALAPAIGAVSTHTPALPRYGLPPGQRARRSVWICTSRNLAVQSNLDRRMTLQQATWSKGASGAQVATWSDVRTNLAARIQPESGSVSIEYDRR